MADLPPGVKAVWDLSKAYRKETPTRERVCINGLWRWQPAEEEADAPPDSSWGHFKVPGSWPGIGNYMQKDSQTVHGHPDWQNHNLSRIKTAWYEREVTVPREWTGGRMILHAEYVNSYAVVYIDGVRVGEIRYPWGAVDLTDVCTPGRTHVLSMFVLAMPLKGVMLSYNDTASSREVKGSVDRRGLCGDVYLVHRPAGARIGDVRVNTSVRAWEITFEAGLVDLEPGAMYTLHAAVSENGHTVAEFSGQPFSPSDLADGRAGFTDGWQPERLWDIHTPENTYGLELSLRAEDGTVVDVAHTQRFGFRELWTEGRDFYLNGSRIYLSAVPLDNAQIGATLACYEGARESLERLKSFGINFVYTHNYGCEPGAHLSFEEILRAADDVGMLVALSQPHFGHYDWDETDADETNGYAHHAAFYAGVAGNHPSVVAYSTSHNATGYAEDMNPFMIDGMTEARSKWSLRNVVKARRAEAIIKRLDPRRMVYHHSSGNLGPMHTSNFYPNFVPIQEMSDWFEHWATEGVKPVFLCEYGAPFMWDWAMYRGWYKGERSFGSAEVPWEFCLAEWSAQFLGDRVYRITEMEKENIRWEAEQFRAGRLWQRWDYPHNLNAKVFEDRYEIAGLYTEDNWRAFRTWGLSANSPWQHGSFWVLLDGVERGRVELEVDWEGLQRPGLSADFIGERYERMDLAFEPDDWVPTATAEALYRNNLPLLAYIGGKPDRFTSKDHLFYPGEIVEKQIVVVNNSRETVTAECEWSFDLPDSQNGTASVTVATGDQERIPLRLDLPSGLAPGDYAVSAVVTFSTGEVQRDTFDVQVLARKRPEKPAGPIALYDPEGETGSLLESLGIAYEPVASDGDLTGCEVLVIGKDALTVDGPGPDLRRVREGMKVVVFEQASDVLEQRLGFRVTEYGIRNVFRRIPDHPLLAGLEEDHLRDWRGEATILPPRLAYEIGEKGTPSVQWCGIEVTRAWRCGNRGHVASVLIEKPAR
ncbi:MAG: hypothetical protein QGI83_14105, partial [Candidatus Latescibacteria bacterium]|nr:hypothetical protein [Candidatus Latescibacterota bacterium]